MPATFCDHENWLVRVLKLSITAVSLLLTLEVTGTMLLQLGVTEIH